jgi:hypothetical protein
LVGIRSIRRVVPRHVLPSFVWCGCTSMSCHARFDILASIPARNSIVESGGKLPWNRTHDYRARVELSAIAGIGRLSVGNLNRIAQGSSFETVTETFRRTRSHVTGGPDGPSVVVPTRLGIELEGALGFAAGN